MLKQSLKTAFTLPSERPLPRQTTALGRRRTFKVCAAGGESNKDKPREPWDVGRFVRTVLFFNPPPSLVEIATNVVTAPLKIISAVAGQSTPTSSTTTMPPSAAIITLLGSPQQVADRDVIMVTGATGGVGKRVVTKLLLKGKKVRALVRDVDKAKSLLSGLKAPSGARLELITADITQKQTLLPEMFAGVDAIVCCTAVKVQPKEGDVDRSKYYQGIKFYDPEIVGDTPESVEYMGMVNLLNVVGDKLGKEGGKLLFSGSGGALGTFASLDDVVMGGASSSSFIIKGGAGEKPGSPAGVFYGRVTSANNGGFCSVRSRNADPAIDVSAYEGLELRVKGDGRRYKAILRSEAGWDGVGYTVSFDTEPDVWQTIRLPFKSFVPVFRAKTVRGGPPLNVSSIYSLQLMHSKFEYDGALNPRFQEGEFELPVGSISTYLPQPPTPKFVLVSSAGVTRPNRPGIDVEQEPPAVKLNDALGGLLTFKLKAEDALRSSSVPFSIIRPVALTEEPSGAPLLLDQGDTIKGKISREEIAELCVELVTSKSAAAVAATNVSFEIKSTVPFSEPWNPAEGEVVGSRDWGELIQGAGLKQGVTGKTVNGVYTGKQPESDVVGGEKAAAV